MKEPFTDANDEITFRIKNKQIVDGLGNAAVAAITSSGTRYLLTENEPAVAGEPSITPISFAARNLRSDHRGLGIVGPVYNRPGFDKGEDCTTSAIVGFEYGNGAKVVITRASLSERTVSGKVAQPRLTP
ncbi:MAG: hypothetical protein M3N08_07610 [Pseudomonadota bacterium]|nr:hypothetical protein [Pseudomonadota bacterium]